MAVQELLSVMHEQKIGKMRDADRKRNTTVGRKEDIECGTVASKSN